MEYYTKPSYLCHHGVKGMKWGVRRYRNKDGSLTPAGKKRYSDGSGSDSKIKQTVRNLDTGHRGRLEKKYLESGMSEVEAKAAAARRIKVEKAIAITAGVTVGACVAYYAKNKWVADHCDQVLKAGTSFHNLDSTANPRPGEHLYVNYRQNDTNYFRGHFAINKMRQTGQVFNHTLTANEDIKIPSLNTRKSVFKELYNADPEFRKAIKENTPYHRRINSKSAKVAYKHMWPEFGNKDDPQFNIARRKYFEALRQKGYEAIVDEWDTNAKVFRSDAPLILLNTSSKSFGEMTIKELSQKDILLAQANSKNWTRKTDALNFITNESLHANHFKESKKYLSRYATKSAKNSSRIDRALEAIDKADPKSMVKTAKNWQVDNLLKAEQGHILANAGKYLEKNGNMSVDKAMSKAAMKELVTTMGTASTGLVGGYAALYKVSKDLGIEQYIRDHPNTKLTTKEIERKIVRGEL